MKTLNFIRAPTIAMALGLLIGACTDNQVVVQKDRQLAGAVSCNGQPDWCVVARSGLDLPVYLYFDGEMQGAVLAHDVSEFPEKAGQRRLITYCGFFDVMIQPQNYPKGPTMLSKELKCSAPREMHFTTNQELDLLPL